MAVPSAPTSVSATDNLTDKVTVTWTAGVGETDGHCVYRNGFKLLVAEEHSGTGNSVSAAVAEHVISSPVNCTGLTKTNGFLVIDLKCSNPELMVSNAQLEITSFGGADVNEWAKNDLTGLGITTSYQTFRIPLSIFDTTGGELEVNAIDYIRWYQFSTGADLTIYWKNAYIESTPAVAADTKDITGMIAHGTTAYNDTTAVAGTIYSYTVYAKNADGWSVASTADNGTRLVTGFIPGIMKHNYIPPFIGGN